tara:strand:+ start:8656 stop:10683 length:2028 start_codon:yes stop_codon:yes gene_type:complete
MWKVCLFSLYLLHSLNGIDQALWAAPTSETTSASFSASQLESLKKMVDSNPKKAYADAALIMDTQRLSLDPEEKIALIGIQSMARTRQGHFRFALERAEAAQKLITEKQQVSPVTQAYIYTAIGHSQEGLGHIPEAMRSYQKAHEHYSKASHQHGMAASRIDIASLFVSAKLYDKAIESYKNALVLIDPKEDSFLYSRILNNLAFTLKENGTPEKALPHLALARQLSTNINETLLLAYLNSNTGEAYYHMGQYELAEKFLNLAMKEAVDRDLESLSTAVNHYLGLIKFSQGKHSESQSFTDRALKNALKFDDIESLSKLYDLKAKLAYTRENYKDALMFRDMRDKYEDELASQNTVTALSLLQADYTLKERQQQITLLQQDNEIQRLSLQDERYLRFLGGGLVIILCISVGALLYTVRIKTTASKLALSREKDLRNAKVAAEKANIAKSQFLSYMSHELRTPLNAVIGFSESLRLKIFGTLNERQLEYVEHIHQSGTLLLKLINDLLHLSKIEAGAIELDLQKCDLRKLVVDIVPTVDHLLKNNDINLHMETLPHDLPPVYVDKIRMDQILLNLISNAIKYGREGGNVWLSIEKTSPERIRVNVKDDGLGIAADQFENVFIPFNRAGKEESGIEGTGAGLSIVKALIEAMRGTIGFESIFNEGSSFWIDVPVADL